MNKAPNFAIGTKYMTRGKHPVECTVTNIYSTYNEAFELVHFRYVSTHLFCGQPVTDYDVVETTVARGLIG